MTRTQWLWFLFPGLHTNNKWRSKGELSWSVHTNVKPTVVGSALLTYNSKAVCNFEKEFFSICRPFPILLVTKDSGKVMANNINNIIYHLLCVSIVLCISCESVHLIPTSILQVLFSVFYKGKDSDSEEKWHFEKIFPVFLQH